MDRVCLGPVYLNPAFVSPCPALWLSSPRKFPGKSREISGSFQGKFPREMRDISGNFREISGKFPGNFREISAGNPGNFRNFSGGFPGHFQGISGNCLENIGKFPGIFPEISEKNPGNFRPTWFARLAACPGWPLSVLGAPASLACRPGSWPACYSGSWPLACTVENKNTVQQ